MNLKVSFLWIGLVVFALPMLINIAYVMFPPVGKAEQAAAVTHWIEIVEQISCIAYLLAVTLIVSRDKLSFRSGWLYLAAAFSAQRISTCRPDPFADDCSALRSKKNYQQALTSNQSVTITMSYRLVTSMIVLSPE